MTIRFAVIAAVIGVIIPLLFLVVDALSQTGWWPKWILFVWPTSYMLIATSGIKDLSAYMLIALSIAVNGAVYAGVGAIAYRFVK
jgi:hypothetical protein